MKQSRIISGRHTGRHWPPPALLDEYGNIQFYVERFLQLLRLYGQYQYLVKYGGMPESENSREYEIPLRQNCPYAVDVFEYRDQGHLETDAVSHH